MRDYPVIERMIEHNYLPNEGTFCVTENLLDNFYNIYREVYPPKTNKKISTSDVRYAKKLAGLSLMKLNMKRAEKTLSVEKIKTKNPNCGIIYIVSNPAFPNIYKIGMTRDLNKRLRQYQTCDPYRQYKIEHYKFVENAKEEEKRLLELYKTDIVKGEWVSTEKVKEMFYISR